MSKTRRLSLKEEAELAVGATGAIISTDQVIKSTNSEDDKLDHLLKAGIGAAVAIGAYELLRRAENGPESSPDHHQHSSSSSHSRPSSSSPKSTHHTRHLFEEIIGAYTLGKELLGDKNHHVRHLVGEAIGATGLLQELRETEKDRFPEENGSK
jgi:hypothetical protein